MRAGRNEGLSIRPKNIMAGEAVEVMAGEDVEVKHEESDEESDVEGIRGERLRLPKDNEFVMKLRDPRLPTQEEVEEHYWDWCPICVQA